jgi:hypothetical protein
MLREGLQTVARIGAEINSSEHFCTINTTWPTKTRERNLRQMIPFLRHSKCTRSTLRCTPVNHQRLVVLPLIHRQFSMLRADPKSTHRPPKMNSLSTQIRATHSQPSKFEAVFVINPDGTYSKKILEPGQLLDTLPAGIKIRDLRTTPSSRQISDFLVRCM